MKIAVLLMAYGGPGSLEEVEPFLSHVLKREKLPPGLVNASKKRYASIGGKSPLSDITFAQAKALEQSLNRDYCPGKNLVFQVYVGMKHWHPFINETFSQIAEDGFDKMVALCLTPQYSDISVGDYFQRLEKAIQQTGFDTPPDASQSIHMIKNWHLNPLFLKAFEQNIAEQHKDSDLEKREKTALLFSAHSLPLSSMTSDDPYPAQVLETAEHIAKSLNWPADRWFVCYQSGGHSAGEWLGPHLSDQVEQCVQKGFETLIITPIGFVSDHIETCYELDIELKETAQALGAKMLRTRSLNDSPLFIQALAEIILGEIQNEIT